MKVSYSYLEYKDFPRAPSAEDYYTSHIKNKYPR